MRRAFERLGQILFTDGYVADGTADATSRSPSAPWSRSSLPGAGCTSSPARDGRRAGGIVRNNDGHLPVPVVGSRRSRGVGGGQIVGAFSDRPEVRELVRYILSPRYGETVVDPRGGFISANQRFDTTRYGPFEQRQAELIYAALADDTFRFDGSDLMPPEIGTEKRSGTR